MDDGENEKLLEKNGFVVNRSSQELEFVIHAIQDLVLKREYHCFCGLFLWVSEWINEWVNESMSEWMNTSNSGLRTEATKSDCKASWTVILLSGSIHSFSQPSSYQTSTFAAITRFQKDRHVGISHKSSLAANSPMSAKTISYPTLIRSPTSFIGESSSFKISSRFGVPITSKIFTSWWVSARNSSLNRSFCFFSFRFELNGKQLLPGKRGLTVVLGSRVWRSSAYSSFRKNTITRIQPTDQTSILEL